MNRALTFKCIDLLLLVNCIIIPIAAIKTNNLWEEIDKMENCYFIGGAYVVASCIINRLVMDAAYRLPIRRLCELIGMVFIVSTLLLKFLIWYSHISVFAFIYIMVMYAGFGWALLYLSATIRELMKIIKYTRQ